MKKLFTLFFFAFLVYGQIHSQCTSAFNDGFESGSYSPIWTAGSGSYTRTVPSSGAAVGTYYLQMTGGSSSHLNGVNTQFPNIQPASISWYVRTANVSSASGYVVIGEQGFTSASDCICFQYFTAGNLRFYSGGSNDYTMSASPNTWYFVELRNLDFVNKNYDIWVNGTMVASNFPFRNPSITGLGSIQLYNFGNTTAGWDQFTIGPAPVNITATGSDPLCFGDSTGSASVNVTSGTPGFSYVWSNGSTSASLSGLMAGTYSVTVTDTIGCVDTTSVTIANPAVLSPTASATDALCNGSADGSAMVSAAGGTGTPTYLWSNGDTSSALSGLAPGAYTVTVTDANGCMATDSVTVGEPAAISAGGIATGVSCNGDTNGVITLAVSGGTPGYTYNWSNGGTTATQSNLVPGAYSVTITDTNSCAVTDSFTVTEPTAISGTLSVTDVACFGDPTGQITLSASGGTPGYTYLWSNGSTGQDLTGVAAGSYSVVITDTNGCSWSDSAAIAEPTSAVSGSASVTDETAGMADGAIDYTAAGGTPGYTYSWSNGSTTEDLTGLTTGTYVVTVTDANGCTFVDSVVVGVIISTFNPQNGPEVNVFPNPASELLNVTISGATGTVEMTLIGLDGRVLHSQTLDTGQQIRAQLPVADLASGTYFLRIQDDAKFTMVRFVRQ